MKKIPILLFLFISIFTFSVNAADSSSSFVTKFQTETGSRIITVYSDTQFKVNIYGNIYSPTGLYWVDNLGQSGSKTSGQAMNESFTGGDFVITHSTHNVLKENGDVFFSLPKGLTPVLEKIPVLQQILLPIRGILPYLIPLVVLLVAFWKGWQFLLQQLRTA